jgi:hypothetical protein
MKSFPDTTKHHAVRPETPVEVGNAYVDALQGRDFELARKYLSDTCFHYRSPVTESSNADDFTTIISRIGPILERIERRKVFTRDDEVCVIMHVITTMENMKDMPVVLLAKVVAGRITDMEVFFDASEYNRMFEVDPQGMHGQVLPG